MSLTWGVYKYLDVLEIKHVSLNESVLNVLVGPGDEEFVVVVGLQNRVDISCGKVRHCMPHLLCQTS